MVAWVVREPLCGTPFITSRISRTAPLQYNSSHKRNHEFKKKNYEWHFFDNVHKIVVTFMHCCAEKGCWLRSTSKDVCMQRNAAHCPDCNLYSSSCLLTAEEKTTVCVDKDAFQRIKLGRSRRFLQRWAQQLRLRNYKRLPLDSLCENIAKVVQGDTTLQSKERKPRRKRRFSKRKSPPLTKSDASTNKRTKTTEEQLPAGYRSCICGTEECKEAMKMYFRKVHDYTWPDKFFPWLYVGIPKLPSSESTSKVTRARARERSLVREEKVRRHKLFCRHLGITDGKDISSNNSIVAFPVHFPLIW